MLVINHLGILQGSLSGWLLLGLTTLVIFLRPWKLGAKQNDGLCKSWDQLRAGEKHKEMWTNVPGSKAGLLRRLHCGQVKEEPAWWYLIVREPNLI